MLHENKNEKSARQNEKPQPAWNKNEKSAWQNENQNPKVHATWKQNKIGKQKFMQHESSKMPE